MFITHTNVIYIAALQHVGYGTKTEFLDEFGPRKQQKNDNETGYKNRRRGCCGEQAVNIFIKPQCISKVKILIEKNISHSLDVVLFTFL